MLKNYMLSGVAAATVSIAPTVGSAEDVQELRWAVPISFSSQLTALGDTLPSVAEHAGAGRCSGLARHLGLGGACVVTVYEAGSA